MTSEDVNEFPVEPIDTIARSRYPKEPPNSGGSDLIGAPIKPTPNTPQSGMTIDELDLGDRPWRIDKEGS